MQEKQMRELQAQMTQLKARCFDLTESVNHGQLFINKVVELTGFKGDNPDELLQVVAEKFNQDKES